MEQVFPLCHGVFFFFRNACVCFVLYRLLLQRGKKVPHMHIWWEMQEKHNKELSKLDDDDDDDEDNSRAAKPVEKSKARQDMKKKASEDDIGSGELRSFLVLLRVLYHIVLSSSLLCSQFRGMILCCYNIQDPFFRLKYKH